MFMQKIRRSTKKHRKLLIVIVVLLMIGVVGSFAVWDSSQGNLGNSTDTLTYAQQADAYKQYIASLEGENVADSSFEDALSLAQLCYYLYYYSNYAVNYELEDEGEVEAYRADAAAALEKSVLYYQQAIATIPQGSSDDMLAGLYANLASVQLVSDDKESALANFDTALALAPNDGTVASLYANYLYTYAEDGGYEVAKAYLEGILANLEEGTEDYIQITEEIAQYDAIEEYYQQLLDALQQQVKDSADTNDTADGSSDTEPTDTNNSTDSDNQE